MHISYRSDVKGEIQQCINAGLTHLHIDIFDGVYINSPYALTFGPQMVHAIYNRFVVDNNHNNNEYITTFSYISLFYQLYNIIFISVYLKASSIVLHFEVIIYKNNKIHLFTINLIFINKNDKSIWIFKKITKLLYFSITLLKSSIAIKLE